MHEPPRAALYCRISEDRPENALGVERQEEDCRRLAAERGFEVIGAYVDNDVSAYSGKRRPEYRRLLVDIDEGLVDVVVTWHTDRLHRSPLELEEWILVCEARGVATHAVQAGLIDLSTPGGRANARLGGLMARYESELKAERVRRKFEQKAAAGEWLGGPVPIGWRLRPGAVPETGRNARLVHDEQVEIDPLPALRIRGAYDDLLAGASLGSIVSAWNAEGFMTATGKPWTYTGLRQVLMRARNAGLVEYRGEVVAPSPWPALVTESAWMAVKALLSDPARRKSLSNRARWLVAGIATCGTCGARLRSSSASSRGKSGVFYRCPTKGAGHVARLAEAVDEQVVETVAAWLGRDDALGALLDEAGRESQAGETDLRSEELALRARLTDVAEMFADGALTRTQLSAATEKINGRLGEIARAAGSSRRGSVLAPLAASPDPARAWREVSIDRKRAILRETVTVTVLPRPRSGPRQYDPAFTVIEPRQ